MKQLSRYLSHWRTTVVRDREIVEAGVRPEHQGPSAELADALETWSGLHYWADSGDERSLVLIRCLGPPQRERWWLHILLFVMTFFAVWMAGAMLVGSSVSLHVPSEVTIGSIAAAFTNWIGRVAPGLQFALALMAILLAHEMGHYVLAKRYKINVSLPYFLPAPFWWTFIGTFGAFIRIRSPIVDRRQLMDVGSAGPWAGFAVAMVCVTVGLSNSTVLPSLSGGAAQVIMVGDMRFYLGDSLMMFGTRSLMGIDGTVLLHPIAFAGWLGLFVTTLNLLPLGQLDGGHVLYALVGDRQKIFGWILWYLLIVLGFQFRGWWLWAGLTLLLGRGRMSHPSVLDKHRPMPANRGPLGWATVLLFVVTFTPIPFPL